MLCGLRTKGVRMGYAVLMTACVDPSQGRIKVQRSDPKVRLEDYKQGLSFWLTLSDHRIRNIVFIENSGYPLDELQTVAAGSDKLVEFISLCNNIYPANAHYGYAELAMIDEAFKRSKMLNDSPYFIKATGRLTFPHVTKLLNRLPDEYLFAVDCRNSRFTVVTPTASTPLMLFSTEFYRENLMGSSQELIAFSGYIEDSLYDKLAGFNGRPGAILRWPVNCSPVGHAAFWHKPKRYDSPQHKAMQAVRAVGRKVIPSWWI